MNFLFVELCDNDYGWHIQDAVEHLIFKGANATVDVEWWKLAIINIVIAYDIVNNCADNKCVRPYLMKSMSVEYMTRPPNVDHDGGSVVHNFNTNITTLI